MSVSVLLSMGYKLDVDFVAFDRGNDVEIEWKSAKPMPTEAEIDAHAPKAEVKRQIAALEAQITPRMIRETALKTDPSHTDGVTRLKQLDDQIRELRKKL